MSKLCISTISKEIMDELSFPYSYLSEKNKNELMKDLVLENNHEESNITEQPFVYIFDCSEEEIDSIFEFFKKKNISFVCSVSTMHNLQWELGDLLKEIFKEHYVFEVMKELKMWIQKTSRLPRDSWVEKVMMASFVAYEHKNVDEMKKMIEILKEIHSN